MVRSASVATARDLSPSRRRSLAVVSSICRRSVSIRLRSRALKSFRVEVLLLERSFSRHRVPLVRIAGGQVVLALAGRLETGLLQGGDHVGAAPHRAVLDALHAGSRGSTRAGRLRARGRPAASSPPGGRDGRAGAPGRAPGRPDGSSRAGG
ncbi:MAG: hypothetical protein OXE58_14455 [Acidobacteria bacterium]|nr:hypothetical protein [Acidobacteriota bacterium]